MVKVCLVHDWLVSYRGGERVLESFMEMFPEAPIYTLFYDPKAMPVETFGHRTIILPKCFQWARPLRKLLLPLLPMMIESFSLEDYDLIISSSSAVAKGALPGPSSYHISYIHSPMRYIWDQKDAYFSTWYKIPVLSELLLLCLSNLRQWDRCHQGIDLFIGNSKFVQQRIKRFYKKDSIVLGPPVDIEFFQKPTDPIIPSPYYLVVGAFVAYKKFDFAIKACQKAKVRLVVAGNGPDEKKLKKLLQDDSSFFSSPSKHQLASLYQHATALLYPGVEDFGITGIEALASGTPVYAANQGGALDYVIPKKTGLLFSNQELDSLVRLLKTQALFDTHTLQAMAQLYSKKAFQTQMKAIIQQACPHLEV